MTMSEAQRRSSGGADSTFSPPVPRLVCTDFRCLTFSPVANLEEGAPRAARGCPQCGSPLRLTAFYNQGDGQSTPAPGPSPLVVSYEDERLIHAYAKNWKPS